MIVGCIHGIYVSTYKLWLTMATLGTGSCFLLFHNVMNTVLCDQSHRKTTQGSQDTCAQAPSTVLTGFLIRVNGCLGVQISCGSAV